MNNIKRFSKKQSKYLFDYNGLMLTTIELSDILKIEKLHLLRILRNNGIIQGYPTKRTIIELTPETLDVITTEYLRHQERRKRSDIGVKTNAEIDYETGNVRALLIAIIVNAIDDYRAAMKRNNRYKMEMVECFFRDECTLSFSEICNELGYPKIDVEHFLERIKSDEFDEAIRKHISPTGTRRVA